MSYYHIHLHLKLMKSWRSRWLGSMSFVQFCCYIYIKYLRYFPRLNVHQHKVKKMNEKYKIYKKSLKLVVPFWRNTVTSNVIQGICIKALERANSCIFVRILVLRTHCMENGFSFIPKRLRKNPLVLLKISLRFVYLNILLRE